MKPLNYAVSTCLWFTASFLWGLYCRRAQYSWNLTLMGILAASSLYAILLQLTP